MISLEVGAFLTKFTCQAQILPIEPGFPTRESGVQAVLLAGQPRWRGRIGQELGCEVDKEGLSS